MTDHTPGSSWRVLVHEGAGRHPAVHMRSEDYDRAIFDELVVDRWFHIEQMDDDTWWMNIGGVTVWVTVGRHGGPRAVSVFAPEDYDGPQAGCDYRLAWRGFSDGAAADEIDRLRAAIRAHRRAIRDGVAEDDWEPDPADLALWRAAGLEADR